MSDFDSREQEKASTNRLNGGRSDDDMRRKRKQDLELQYARIPHKNNFANGDLTLNDAIEQIRSLFSIVRNRWFAGLSSMVLVLGVFGYFVLKSEPEYTAVSTLLAQSPLDELLSSDGGARTSKNNSQENLLQNHLSVMQSRRFSVALASEFSDEERELIVTPYMDPAYDPSTASMAFFEGRLAKRMGATRQRDREFFTFSFRHRDPDVAIMVADRMTATYLKIVQEEIREANLSAAEILKEEANQLQSEISSLEEKQREFRELHNIVSVQENQGLLAERLRRIDENRYDARIERLRLEAIIVDAEKDMSGEELPYYNPHLSNFANNQELRLELDQLTAERKVLALRYGRNHPKMLDIDGKIGGVLENLKRNFDLAYRDLENKYKNLLSVEQQLESEFKEEFGEGIEVGRLADRFEVMGNEVEAKKETLDDLLRRISNAVIASKLPADVMRVVDPAFLAKSKLGAKKLTAFAGVVLAGGVFFGIPLILHVFDQRLKCATDIEKELGKDLVGGVPGLSKIKAIDRPHVVRDSRDASKVEPFMAIIAQLELVSRQKGTKSFCVTSTATGEGKSTISSNLASGFAQIGRKTLVVDGDLRRPCQHQFHRVNKGGGLLRWAESGYLTENLFEEDSPLGIQKVSNGSFLLPAGGVYSQPAQFLISSHFNILFEKLKENFDIIIVDTPPAGLYPDALVLAKQVSETVLIAREAKARVSQIRRVITDIDNTTAPVLGVILNDFSPGSLNPRLNIAGGYEGLGAYLGRDAKEKTASAAKSIVSRIMDESDSTRSNLANQTRHLKRPKKGPSRGRTSAAPKSLIGKLMSDEIK